MKELIMEARGENILTVTEFVDEQLEAFGCPVKAQMQIDIAIDELFGNISHYAYNPGAEPATVQVEVQEDPLSMIITFIDHGVPYAPLPRTPPIPPFRQRNGKLAGLGSTWSKRAWTRFRMSTATGRIF